ncbi:MAG: hypothetical protein U0X73_09370 [Thermoanaerobaculia bacterium]
MSPKSWRTYLVGLALIAEAGLLPGNVAAQCHDLIDECAIGARFCFGFPTSLRMYGPNLVDTGGWLAGSFCGWKPCWNVVCPCGRLLADDVCEWNRPGQDEESKLAELNEMVLSPDSQNTLYGDAADSVMSLTDRGTLGPNKGEGHLSYVEETGIRKLAESYRRLTSIRAKIGITFALPSGMGEDQGTLDLEMEPERFSYRLNLGGSSALGPGMSAAFDGATYQLLTMPQQVLTLQSRPWVRTGRTFPNPIFLAAWPLLGHDLKCTTCDLSLSAMHSIDSAFLEGSARVISRRGNEVWLALPGVADDQQGDYFRVLLDSKTVRLLRAELHSSTGSLLATIDYNYSRNEPSGGRSLPTDMEAWFSDPDQTSIRIRFQFLKVQINEPLDASGFSIDPGLARIVVDADVARLLKHPRLAN